MCRKAGRDICARASASRASGATRNSPRTASAGALSPKSSRRTMPEYIDVVCSTSNAAARAPVSRCNQITSMSRIASRAGASVNPCGSSSTHWSLSRPPANARPAWFAAIHTLNPRANHPRSRSNPWISVWDCSSSVLRRCALSAGALLSHLGQVCFPNGARLRVIAGWRQRVACAADIEEKSADRPPDRWTGTNDVPS